MRGTFSKLVMEGGMRSGAMIGVLMLAALAASGCVGSGKYEQAVAEAEEARNKAEKVQLQKKALEDEVKSLREQKNKLAAAYKDFFVEIEKQRVKEDKLATPPPPPVNKEVADKLSKVRDEKIKSALSADQFKKYTEIEKTMRPHMPPGMPGEQKPPANKKH